MDVLCHIHQQIHKISRLPTYSLRNNLFRYPHCSRLYTKIVYIKRNLWPTIKLQVGVNLDDFEDKIIAGTKSENQFFSGSSSLFRYTRDLNLTIKVRGKSILNERFRAQPTTWCNVRRFFIFWTPYVQLLFIFMPTWLYLLKPMYCISFTIIYLNLDYSKSRY